MGSFMKSKSDNEILNRWWSAMAGSETVHLGEIGGSTIVTAASPVLTAATPYVSGYLAGGGLTFLNAGRTAGNTGVVQSVVLTDAGKKNSAFDLVLFNELPATTVFADCTPFVVDAADLFKIAGVVSIAATDYVSFSTKSVATKTNTGIVYDLPSTTTTLFGALVIRAAATYAATDLSLRLGLLRD